jgi:hypothetical protein
MKLTGIREYCCRSYVYSWKDRDSSSSTTFSSCTPTATPSRSFPSVVISLPATALLFAFSNGVVRTGRTKGARLYVGCVSTRPSQTANDKETRGTTHASILLELELLVTSLSLSAPRPPPLGSLSSPSSLRLLLNPSRPSRSRSILPAGDRLLSLSLSSPLSSLPLLLSLSLSADLLSLCPSARLADEPSLRRRSSEAAPPEGECERRS